MKKIVALFAVAGLAAVASAQPTFDVRYRFSTVDLDTGVIAPVTGPINGVGGQTYTFMLQAGVFNFNGNGATVRDEVVPATGSSPAESINPATNRGLGVVDGSILSTGGASFAVPDGFGRQDPFSFGDATGVVAPGAIAGFSALHITETITGWARNTPAPLPSFFGVDEYADIFLFQVTLDADFGLVTVDFDGVGRARSSFAATAFTRPPAVGTGTGSVTYFFDVFAGSDVADGTGIVIIPAPGAVALLGLGGLVAARRRRA